MKVNKEVITKIIKELGIPANLKGYHYLIYRIETLISGTGRLDSMMKFYQGVAEEFNTTPSRVERAIRNAIETGWNRANIDFVHKLFRYTVDPKKDRPTNSEFLATVADYIILTQERTGADD